MKIFKLHIISDEEYKELERSYFIANRVIQCHRWFSGWKDLDVIWDYILKSEYFGGISSARDEYAEKRKTNRYGNSL